MQHFGRMIAIAGACCTAAVAGCASGPVAQVAPTHAVADRSADPPQQMAAAVAPYAPPPELAEIPPPAPTPNSLWRFGHWVWSGTGYHWTRGHYIERPTPTDNWSRGYWQQGPDGWVWIEGHWTS
ncbi:MAG TPA: hypothetical protein VMF05_03480 [Stellaceae bacterium]|jgi:hypothetical protein|nr:hypothetical protein [Stellaceae bacterium]